MPLNYNVIQIFTSEEVVWEDEPLYLAILEYVKKSGTLARCMVSKGIAGLYENGEIATSHIEILSYNMPLKIEVIIHSSELDRILPGIEDMVTNGIVVVENMKIKSHKK